MGRVIVLTKMTKLRTMTRLAAIVLVAWMLAFPGGAGAARAASDSCFADWQEAGPVIKENDLTPATQLADLLRQRVQGELVKITLCKQGDGRYIYRLTFSQASGQFTNLTVDAKDLSEP